MLIPVAHRLHTRKPSPTNLKPKVNTLNNQEAVDNMVMFGCVLNQKSVEVDLNLLTPSEEDLFLKNLLLLLKRELRRRWTKVLSPDFRWWICRLLCMTVLTMKLTHLKLLSKLPEPWLFRRPSKERSLFYWNRL